MFKGFTVRLPRSAVGLELHGFGVDTQESLIFSHEGKRYLECVQNYNFYYRVVSIPPLMMLKDKHHTTKLGEVQYRLVV